MLIIYKSEANQIFQFKHLLNSRDFKQILIFSYDSNLYISCNIMIFCSFIQSTANWSSRDPACGRTWTHRPTNARPAFRSRLRTCRSCCAERARRTAATDNAISLCCRCQPTLQIIQFLKMIRNQPQPAHRMPGTQVAHLG